MVGAASNFVHKSLDVSRVSGKFNHMEPILVCDIVEYGLDSFGKRPQTYRVTHYLKRVDYDFSQRDSEDSSLGSFIDNMMRKFVDEEREERREAGLPCSRRYKLIYCKQEDATHFSLAGICGALAPISECKKVRTVDWSQELIQEERDNATSDFWLSNARGSDWYWE